MHHHSSSGLRPRQRTFTSCTECRRRKQRCNQAKDRPCNNCSRRYPPVVCTYESSSPPPTIDSIVDFQDDQDSRPTGRGSEHPSPAYVQTTQSSIGVIPATTAADGRYYPSSSQAYYSTSPMRGDYRYGGESSSTPFVAYTSSGSYVPVSAGYYQNVQTGYSTATATGGYYSSAEPQGGWLSSNGDPGAFVGASSADYYYIPEPDPGHSGHSTSGP